MKQEALYNKTVGILVDAYFKNTLQHGNCFACAIGNLVAGNCGYLFVSKKYIQAAPKKPIGWKGFKRIEQTLTYSIINNESLTPATKGQLESVGYSFRELMKIEKAFESVVLEDEYTPIDGQTEDEAMFNGLMEVIDVLDIIHENTSPEITLQTKKRFEKVLS